MSKSIDKIISRKLNCEVATIIIESISSDSMLYKARILENYFPAKLLNLINDYDEIVSNQMFSVLDDVSRKINSYELILKSSSKPLFEIYIHENIISFAVKFPTPKGYLDNYPEY